eukprot:4544143-Pyramimonas_sp.AAC.1
MAQRRRDSCRTHSREGPVGGAGCGQKTHSPSASATRNAQGCLRTRPRSPVGVMPDDPPM